MKQQLLFKGFIIAIVAISAFALVSQAKAGAGTTPDLKVSSILVDKSLNEKFEIIGNTYQVGYGDSVLLYVGIENIGTAESSDMTVNIYVMNSLSDEEKLVSTQNYSNTNGNGGTLAPGNLIDYKYGIDASNFAEGKNTITVKVVDNTKQNDSTGVYPENNLMNNQMSASMAVNKPTVVADLAITGITFPAKAVLGSDVMVEAIVSDLSMSGIKEYSIITSVMDSQNHITVVSDRIFNGGTIGKEGIIYKFLIDNSKLKLGVNTITVQVNDEGNAETTLENNSLNKSIEIINPSVVNRRYPNSVLLRSITTGKIYLIKANMKYYISGIAELKSYRGLKMYDVDDSILNLYFDYNIKPYGDNVVLISKSNNKAYLIKNGMKYYISTLIELGKYRMNKHFIVYDGILNLYANSK
ncbi:MAG: hypothetical protein WCV92_02345 [Candidatus Buchananbacteria bacterium]